MIANVPAECDLPGMSCAGGGSWWPFIIGTIIVAGLVWRGWPK